MAKPRPITAIDIGSGTIKIFSVIKARDDSKFEVLGLKQKKSLGIRKGVVVDESFVSQTIAELSKELEEETGNKIDQIYVSFGGTHLSCDCSRGMVSVSRADKKVSEEDVKRVIQAAKILPLSSNKEIIAVFPKEFIVDGEGKIKDPVGMEGIRLESEVLAVFCFSPYLKSSTQAILKSGLQLADLVPCPLASAKSVLTPQEKELGVVLLDIGAGVTSMAVFEEDNLIHLAVFPVGSGNITNDIAICLKIDIDVAEKIKLEFGASNLLLPKKRKSKKSNKKISLEGKNGNLVFSERELSDIIEARVLEIFNFANKELKKIARQELLPAGVVLTGGGAKLPGIVEFAKKEMKLPCRLGVPNQFFSLPEDSSFSALCGLAIIGYELENNETGRVIIPGKGFFKKIIKFLRSFIP